MVLFNKSLESGVYPNAWKSANIQPIHKKSKKNLVTNYRPIISILRSMPKILYNIVTSKIYDEVICKIIQEQRDFVKGIRSTLTNLLSYNDFKKISFLKVCKLILFI